jgi:hypothetical protein
MNYAGVQSFEGGRKRWFNQKLSIRVEKSSLQTNVRMEKRLLQKGRKRIVSNKIREKVLERSCFSQIFRCLLVVELRFLKFVSCIFTPRPGVGGSARSKTWRKIAQHDGKMQQSEENIAKCIDVVR